MKIENSFENISRHTRQ